MSIGPAELARELKLLRKGRGVQAAKLAEQVGPTLRELCGLDGTQNTAVIRDRLTVRLRALAAQLPADLELTVTVALALQPDTRHQFLRERIQYLADQQQRDVRTIRRRMDEGLKMLAELAARPTRTVAADNDFPWRVELLETVLRMDKPTPESFERRVIVSQQEELDRITAMTTLPRGEEWDPERHSLLAEVYYGAALLKARRVHENRFEFDLMLPRPLARDERHEYGIILRVPEDQPMRNHYVLFPKGRIERFHLRLRFGQDRTPRRLWRVDEVFHREIDDLRPTGPELELDGVGEVSLEFHGTRPGHGYGAQWLPT